MGFWKKIVSSGIMNAAINGAVGAAIGPAVVTTATDLSQGGTPGTDWGMVGKSAAGFAILGVVNWLAARQKKPIPDETKPAAGDPNA